MATKTKLKWLSNENSIAGQSIVSIGDQQGENPIWGWNIRTINSGEGIVINEDSSPYDGVVTASLNINSLTSLTTPDSDDVLLIYDVSSGTHKKINFDDINHDDLNGYVTNEHIDHSNISISGGIGLSGGGDLTTNRTLNLDINELTEETSIDVNNDYTVIYTSDDPNHKKAKLSNILIFGTEYQYSESEAQSTTTSSSYVQKLRMTTPTIPAGTYRIGWSAEIHPGNSGEDEVQMQVELDDTTQLSECENQVDDMVWGIDNGVWHPVSGFKHIALTNASHTIDIDYLAIGGGTAYIRKARIEFWRVS